MTRARIYVAIAVLTAFLTGSIFAGYIEPRLSNTPATLTEQPGSLHGNLPRDTWPSAAAPRLTPPLLGA